MYCLLQDLNVDFRIRFNWSTAEYETLFLEQMIKRDAEKGRVFVYSAFIVADCRGSCSWVFSLFPGEANSSFPWSCSTAHNINMQMSSHVISTDNTAALRPVRAGLPACRAELTNRSLLTFLCRMFAQTGAKPEKTGVKSSVLQGKWGQTLRNNTIISQMMMMKKRQFLLINRS